MIQQRRLWQAVLVQALVDAVRTDNFIFFNEKNIDLLFICGMAGIELNWLLQNLAENKILSVQEIKYTRRIKKGVPEKAGESNYMDSWNV